MNKLFLLPIAIGSVLSASAQLTNVSIRTVQTSAFDTTTTFEIPEGAAQEILIRDVGPTLSLFGVQGALTDPAIELSKNGVIIAGNDNWADSNAAALRQAFQSSGAFSFTDGSKDAALLVTLDPGKYSLRSYSTTGSGSGAILQEIFARQAGLQSFGMTNLFSDSSQPGFFLGLVPRNGSYLVRSLGPSLGQSGIGDPKLEIFNNARPGPTNDDWGSSSDAAEIAAAGLSLGLSPLAPGSKDAAILLQNLTPSAYTVIGRNSGKPGRNTLEIYDLSAPNAVAPIPEPATYGLLGAVAAALVIFRRRARLLC